MTLSSASATETALQRVGELNTGPALQWRQGLPAGLEHRITWRQFAGLRVGIARDELSAAADWVRTQDPSPGFAKTLAKAIEYVLREAR